MSFYLYGIIRNMYFSLTTNRWHAFCISLQSVFMDVIKFFDLVEIVTQIHEHKASY